MNKNRNNFPAIPLLYQNLFHVSAVQVVRNSCTNMIHQLLPTPLRHDLLMTSRLEVSLEVSQFPLLVIVFVHLTKRSRRINSGILLD